MLCSLEGWKVMTLQLLEAEHAAWSLQVDQVVLPRPTAKKHVQTMARYGACALSWDGHKCVLPSTQGTTGSGHLHMQPQHSKIDASACSSVL